MKKLRIIVVAATVLLLILMVIGIAILIINQRLDFLDTSYEIIAFSVGMMGMLMSVVSQIDSYRQEKVIDSMKKELAELGHESDQQIRDDQAIKRKLNKMETTIEEEFDELAPIIPKKPKKRLIKRK